MEQITSGRELAMMRGMPPPPKTVARQSPISATRRRRIGACGSSQKIGANSFQGHTGSHPSKNFPARTGCTKSKQDIQNAQQHVR
jgi:hypothetical protein